MRKSLVVGILRETKECERRTPLTPADVKWIVDRKIRVEVESSDSRAYKDSEYKEAGAKIVNNGSSAELLLGVKEQHPQDILHNKIYMIFSHTIKGQIQNMPLLKSCLKRNITLIDYENIVDPSGKRLVYFGRFAGICGAIDSLHYFGKKLELKRIPNPFASIKPAYEYASLASAKKAVLSAGNHINKYGLDKRLQPFIVGITGHGNVKKGVDEIMSLLSPAEIHPKDMERFFKSKGSRKKIYKIVFYREEKLRAKNGSGFYFEEYLKNPCRFESNLDKYIPYLNMYIHTSYWDKRYPKLVTKKMINELAQNKPFRLEFIGDISCDINGSVELTNKTNSQKAPIYTYDAHTRKYYNGYQHGGIAIMAVDNLPTQLPKDASAQFSSLMREYVYQLASHGTRQISDHAAIPLEIRKAVVTEKGRLSGEYSYLKKCI